MPLFELNTEDRIIIAKVQLQRRNPFFAYILMNMRITATQKDSPIDTMAVNAIGDLFFSPKFVEELDQDQVTGVLAHEAMHIATGSFPRKGKRDMFLWNIATDYVINYLLTQEDFKLPPEVLLPDANGDIVIRATKPGEKTIKIKLDNTVFAEELYDQLLNHREQVMQNLGVKEIFIGGGQGGQGPATQGGNSYQKANGQFDYHLDGDKDDMGNSQGKLNNAADVHANEQLWKGRTVEAATAAKSRGKMSSAMERHVGELLEPKIDWRKKLMSFVTRELPVDYTMRLPGRRTIMTGVYLPSIVRENMEVFVAVDVSGSIGGDEYKQFLSEIMGIARGYTQVKMKIVFWSTYVDEADDLDMFTADEEQLLSHVVKNSGGTTMSCVKEYCEKKNYNPRLMIFLTDGMVEPGPEFLPGCKNFFVLSANSSDEIVSKFGEICKLSDIESNDY